MSASVSPPRGKGRCPICTASSEVEFKPFCSRRCADVDLSRWLRGAYAIPDHSTDADEDGDDARPVFEPSRDRDDD
jgi:endogenous inhibitor of DNA gyrase (YacG/DUF329 family)